MKHPDLARPCSRHAAARPLRARFEPLEQRLVFNASSAPDNLTADGSTLYFTANDGIHGSQIWTSGGDAFTTSMLSDINPGSVGGVPQDLTVVGSQVFFTANDGTNGRELWVTTGPGDFNTFLVKDINPGSGSSNPEDLVAFDGLLFFTANDGTHGRQLWESDGTAVDTFMVKDINPDGSSNPQDLTVVGSTLYFTANDGTHGTELWSTTGSAGSFVTTLVKDINPGSAGSAPNWLTDFNGTLFFTADDGTHGTELWTSNGTTTGTTMVDDIDPGAIGSNPSDLTVFNNVLFFSANNGTNGIQLWSSTGTASGTNMVAPSSGATDPDQLTVGPTQLFFSASDSTHGRELWSTAGTASTTAIVDDINPGSASSNPQFLTESNGTLFFAATGSNGTQLWESSGTTSTTHVVANTGTSAVSLFPSQLTDVNGLLYFTANDGTHGRELWTSDGVTSDTAMVLDINTTSTALNIAPILNVNQTPQMTTIVENTTSNSGTLVSTLLASGAEGNPIWDPDSGDVQGIAVTQVDNTNGAWQYTTSGGSTWTAFGSITETSAVLLASNASTSIRFVPNTNFSGDVPGGITFRAWDQTSGTNGGTADTSTNGGSTAFSSATLSANIRVAPASSSAPWQNPVNPDDVNDDGAVTPIDALTIINELNNVGEHVLPTPTAGDQPPPYYDVNGDGSVTPLDALDVINYLNTHLAVAVASPTLGTAAVTSPASAIAAVVAPAIDTAPVAFAISATAAFLPAVASVQNQARSAAATDAAFAGYSAHGSADSGWQAGSTGVAASALPWTHRAARFARRRDAGPLRARATSHQVCRAGGAFCSGSRFGNRLAKLVERAAKPLAFGPNCRTRGRRLGLKGRCRLTQHGAELGMKLARLGRHAKLLDGVGKAQQYRAPHGLANPMKNTDIAHRVTLSLMAPCRLAKRLAAGLGTFGRWGGQY